MKIQLIKPFINQEVKNKVLEVLESGYLTEGKVTHDFEDAFKRYIGCAHAIAVTSCTTGLELALRCLNIGPGDEVIVPDYTYPATASVVAIVGAKPVLVDVGPDTMLIDYKAIEGAINARTKAIIPVSIFGNPLDYKELDLLKQRYKLFIVEDAACSLGAACNGKRVGRFADISVFSLHPRKFITTGEGGMITTDNPAWAEWLNSYKHFGMGHGNEREQISFDRIGGNYKLSDLQAAVGLVQMLHIDDLLERRLALSDNYFRLLKDCSNIRIPETTEGGLHSRQSFCIFIEDRNKVLFGMRENGIEVQIGTYALHRYPAFANHSSVEIRGSMAGSNYAFEHCLTLPLHHYLSESQQETIIDTLVNSLARVL
jgi:perosamine synthetase